MSVASLGSNASPLSRLLSTIASQASSGTISATDATALDGAATSIDASLKADAKGARASGPPSPKDFKAKIDALVDGQVKSGALTSDQASELKDAFAKSGPHGARGGPDGPGGPGGAGGPPPGPPPSQSDDDSDESAGTTTSGTKSVADILQSFLDQLRGAQSDQRGYGGTQAANRSFSAVLIDFQA